MKDLLSALSLGSGREVDVGDFLVKVGVTRLVSESVLIEGLLALVDVNPLLFSQSFVFEGA